MIKDHPENFIIGVMTCPKYAHRANSIRQTWLTSVPSNVRVFFVYGRPGQPASSEGNSLYLDCPEAYENLPEKVHRFFVYCAEHFIFDYVLKTDDDSFVDTDRFLALDKQSADYIGLFKGMADVEATRSWHYGKCTDKSYEVPYEGAYKCDWARGGGYLLSAKAVNVLVEKTATTYSLHLFEDKMVGEALTLDPRIKTLNVHYVDLGILNPMPPKNMVYVHELQKECQNLRSSRVLNGANPC